MKIAFFEDISQEGTPVSIYFQVLSGGFLDVDVEVKDPNGELIYEASRETDGQFAFNTQTTGFYSFCFSNRMSTLTSKIVELAVSVGEHSQVARAAHLDPLEEALIELEKGVASVKEEQKYMRAREVAHRNTSESTNGRVLWWTFWEALVLIAMSIWQIYYIKRFFEVKSIV
eukprot:TRINITY_DN7782_c0_g1_i3.p1 TRINITY_DN7782_c0_g1~~TRINITY_DN7782_c0_g1_i3.p1  ORF type:complete len:172 (+),score=30.58 TRINITY_DN7782_c0_g1_i3:136-651(+)